ncbi:MAG: MBL fold metallo-hydrolase [Spirochaetota bacterium]
MARLYLLGTGAALSDPERTTTMLAVENDVSLLLIDCGGDVVQRLFAAGAGLRRFSALILTHEHPDHVSGFPLFMEKMWLSGYGGAIPVCGILPAIDQARRCLETFDTTRWEGFPRVRWHEVSQEAGAEVWSDEGFRVTAAPGAHGVPVTALRIEDLEGGGVVTFSADTEPSAAVAQLAGGSDILVHEATGRFAGHSDAEQAADIAAQAEVGRLLLVHLPSAELLGPATMMRATQRYGATELGSEGGSYSF